MDSEAEQQRRARRAAAQAIEGEIADLEERLRAHGETPLPAPAFVAGAAGETLMGGLREHRRALREQLARARSRPRAAAPGKDGGDGRAGSNPVGVPPPRARRPGPWLVAALVAVGIVAGVLIRDSRPPPAPPQQAGGLRVAIDFAGEATDDRTSAARVALAAALAGVTGIDLVASADGANALPVQKAAGRARLRLVATSRSGGNGWRLSLLPGDGAAAAEPLWQQVLVREPAESEAEFARRAAARVADAAREAAPARP